MARIRTIKPGFFQDEDLSKFDSDTHLLAAALLCYADDEGYFKAHPRLIHVFAFPLRDPIRPVAAMLADLESIGYIEVKVVDDKSYGRVVKFLEHQRISKPQPSKIKELWNGCGTVAERLGNGCGTVSVGKEGNKEGKGMEGERNDPAAFNASEMARILCIQLGFLSEPNMRLVRDCIEMACNREQMTAEESARFIESQWAKYRARAPGSKLRFFLSDGLFLSEKEGDWHGTNKQNSKAELRSDASHAAIEAAHKRRLAANGYSDAEPS